MSWFSRIANAFRAGRVDRELDEELQYHLEARMDELRRAGLDPREAEREARRMVGNSMALRETSRDIRLAPRVESLWRDMRFGVRLLWKDRVITLGGVLSLALAIGACTAAFSLIDALILRPLPVYRPERLVYLTYDRGGPVPSVAFSYATLERFRAVSGPLLELFAASAQYPATAVFDKDQEKVQNQFVSGNFFEVLGITPAIGRVLTPNDDLRPGQHPMAVLSHSFWMRRFGGSPSVLGKWFRYAGKPFQIVGVAREGFTGVERGIHTDFWTPLTMQDAGALTRWDWNWLRILGRLRPGIAAAQVRPVLQAVYSNARREWAPQVFGPNDSPKLLQQFLNTRVDVQPGAGGHSNLRQSFARPLWVLAVVAGLVLLIACSNLANLFTARAMAREREMALRVSIGAGRGRLVQQVLAEGAVLAAAAASLGLAFGAIAAPAIVSMLGTSQRPVYLEVGLGWRMVAFACAAGFAAMLLFALIPALRASGVAPQEALKSGGVKHSGRRAVLRPLLAAQVAFSFMVLFGGGMFLLSFWKLANLDLGFAREGVVLLTVATDNNKVMDAQVAMTQLLDRVRAVPGVRSAGISAFELFGDSGWSDTVRIPGRAPDSTEAYVVPVTPGYFSTMGIRLLAGRDITSQEVFRQAASVLVNEAFARHFFPGENPVGKLFFRPESRGPNRDYAEADRGGYPQQIVGLVRDVHYDSVRDPAPPTYYIPLTQMWSASMAVRTAADPMRVVPLVREAVRTFGHSLRTTEVTLQSTLVNDALIRERLLAILSGFFALVSIALAAVGLYGVMNYSVVRRTREIGIRVALGARRASVVRLIVSEVALVTAVGLAAGFGGGKLLAGSVAKLLYEVKPGDAASLAFPIACLLGAAAIAAVRPALRAARVEPSVALREE
jgi:putative ABC transport system permease protein